MDDSGFLDLIYGAAVEPDQWTTVLERVADIMGGNSAWVSRLDVSTGAGSGVLARLDPAYSSLYLDYYADMNPFCKQADPRSFMASWRPKVTTDVDWVDKDDLLRSEYFNDFLAPQDVFSFAMIRLAVHGLDECAITVHRDRKSGPFSADQLAWAQRLQPHMIRAFHLTERLAAAGLAHDQVQATLDHTPYGVFLLDDLGRLRRANRAGEALLAGDAGLALFSGKLTATRTDAARELDALIRSAGDRDPARRLGGSMVLRPSLERSPLSLIVAPIRAERLTVFDHRPSVVVCVSDPDAGQPVAEERLRSLYGFTRAEARLAMALLGGATSREAAAALGVSFNTVRNQVRALLEKTGARRQSELVAALLRAAGPSLN